MNILSIQSAVAYGHVGNSAAGFALQRLGHEVWRVDTVQFSNHTGYDTWRGPVLSANAVAEVLAGIAERGVLPACDGVLTGYIGEAALGRVILDAVARARAANPRVVYCCDPVIGDTGRGVYVRPGVAEFLRRRAVPAADIITPNPFELEHLTDRPARTLDEALAACAAARALGPRLVLLTSLRRADGPDDGIEMLLSAADGAWRVATPRLAMDPTPNGAGDLVAALFLARYLEGGDPVAALAQVAASIFAVFEATQAAGSRELLLVTAQHALVAPPRRFTAERVA
jgi:pyridoxine kinase